MLQSLRTTLLGQGDPGLEAVEDLEPARVGDRERVVDRGGEHVVQVEPCGRLRLPHRVGLVVVDPGLGHQQGVRARVGDLVRLAGLLVAVHDRAAGQVELDGVSGPGIDGIGGHDFFGRVIGEGHVEGASRAGPAPFADAAARRGDQCAAADGFENMADAGQRLFLPILTFLFLRGFDISWQLLARSLLILPF